ncbi:MAG: hypothetical protein ACHQY2_05385, partial [Candidatus Eremiobacterales bacterium]
MTRRSLRLSTSSGALALAAVCAALAGTAAASDAASATSAANGAAALAKFTATWDKLSSYSCALSAHEVLGTRVQDRTYTFTFRKPYDTKMDITGGDGKGGAAVWHGGDTLRGHQGGFISFIKLNLNIHDGRATSIRGTTIAQANYGSILDHVKSLKGTVEGSASAGGVAIDFSVPDPSGDESVTKERVVLASDGLPSEYDQWEGDTLV